MVSPTGRKYCLIHFEEMLSGFIGNIGPNEHQQLQELFIDDINYKCGFCTIEELNLENPDNFCSWKWLLKV